MTALPPPVNGSTDMTIPELAAGQFAYHVRMTAVFALAGESAESASEAVLAWTMLMHRWPQAEVAATAADRSAGGGTPGSRSLTSSVAPSLHHISLTSRDLWCCSAAGRGCRR